MEGRPIDTFFVGPAKEAPQEEKEGSGENKEQAEQQNVQQKESEPKSSS